MRTYPTYIENAGTFTVEDTLCGVIKAAIARTALEVLTAVIILSGFFGTISLLSGLFSDSDVIRTVAIDYIRITGISFGAYGMVMASCAAFNGIGRPLPGVVVSVLRAMVILMPMVYAGKALLGLNGIFIAAALANIFTGKETTVAVKSVVVVGLRLPNDTLYHDLMAREKEATAAGIKSIERIGDCLAAGALVHAVYSGHSYARQLDQTDSELYLRDIPVAENPPGPVINPRE